MQINFIALFFLTLAFTFTGCASRQKQAVEILPESHPPVREFKAYKGQSIPAAGSVISTETEEITGSLRLQKVLSLSLMKNPALAAFSWEVRAMEAAKLQASLLPNPELDIELENLAGTEEMSGTDAMETTIQLSQLIELGGKRNKRDLVATLEHDLARWDYEAKRLDIFSGATIAFIDVLSAQEHLALAEDMASLAEKFHTTVSDRVTAGKVSPVEKTKAAVTLSRNRIKVERMKRSLKAARKNLAAYWGSSVTTFEKVVGELHNVSPIPSSTLLETMISRNPDIARRVVEMEKYQAALDLSKAGRIPDLTVSGGYRRFNETDKNAFVIGLSVPLLFFNRNQGDIAESSYRLSKGAYEKRAVETEVKKDLNESYQKLSIAYTEVNALKTEVLPGAQLAFDAANEGYQLGKFNFLDVLDAQRILFDSREQYLDALSTYHTSVAEVERLIGIGLDDITNMTEIEIKGDN